MSGTNTVCRSLHCTRVLLLIFTKNSHTELLPEVEAAMFRAVLFSLLELRNRKLRGQVRPELVLTSLFTAMESSPLRLLLDFRQSGTTNGTSGS